MTRTSDSTRAPGVALDDATREAARCALLAMLAEAPVHRIAMREAARRAGLGLATLYKYFGGKEAMVLAVVEPELDALVAALAQASRREIGVKRRVSAVLDASIRFARDHTHAARAVFLNLPAGVWDEDASAWRSRRQDVLVQILKSGVHDGSVRADLAPETLADIMLGALDRWVETALRKNEPIDPARTGAALFAALWPAVSAD
jgi:AcrR family transcriptional regulator